MGILRRPWLRLVLAAILVIGIFSFFAWDLITRSFPQQSGQIIVAGLSAPVEVLRTEDGVPHIYADNERDLFFAQGYIHAQDRFWQMDFFRHVGRGRLSEMFGASQLETDTFLQTLGWEQIAQREFDQLDSQTHQVLQAYSQGVNAYLDGRRPGQISLEYAILGLLSPDYEIPRWHPIDTLTWAKSMAWDLGGNMDGEIDRAILLDQRPPDDLAFLYPSYPTDHPVVARQTLPSSRRSNPAEYSALPGFELAPDLNARIGAISILERASLDGIGSNNWVIGPELTNSGSPILANDTHLGIQMPSIWYENGLHCQPVSSDCQLQVAGFSFAGAPGVVIGHNQRIAWGVTNAGPDVQDLFIERLDPAQPDHYLFEGEWLPLELDQRTLDVAGQEPVTITVRSSHHGPLITDRYGPLEDLKHNRNLPADEHYAFALRWTALDPSTLVTAILDVNKSQDWDQFRAALSHWDVPAQNIVYADIDGNIGYQLPGQIPIRSSGQGWLPQPGWTGEFEWEGMIPYEELPTLHNPDEGFIVTANNAIVGDQYPYFISRGWDYGYRADRIHDLIDSEDVLNTEDVQEIQGDNQHPMAQVLVPHLERIDFSEGEASRWTQRLANWDGQNHLSSAEAAVFNALWRQLVDHVFNQELGEAPQPGSSRAYLIISGMLAEPNSTWWDLDHTSRIENRDDILTMSMEAALADVRQQLGEQTADWRWGDLHTATFRNQSLGQSGVAPIEALFNRGPFPTSGGTSIVNATSWNPDEGYEVTSLPSQRLILDLSDWDLGQTMHTTGQSGHAFHPNYDDLIERWSRIEFHSLAWSRASVEAQTSFRLELRPE